MFKFISRFIGLFITMISLLIFLLISFLIVIGISNWYQYQEKDIPKNWGITWSTKHAQDLNLDPINDLDSLLSQIPFKRLQLNAYWDIIELNDNQYDFSDLRKQFEIASSRNLKISLQLGIHQSYKDHCHIPEWINNLRREEFINQLKDYLKDIISEFDESINLVQYQLEPEILNVDQKKCSYKLNQNELEDIFLFINNLTDKNISISRNLSLISFKKHTPEAKSFGLVINPHKKGTLTSLENKIPALFYSFHAGNLRLINSDSQTFIRKLVIEPTSYNQANWNVEQVEDILNYANNTSLKVIDISSGEWLILNEGTDIFETVKQTVKADF